MSASAVLAIVLVACSLLALALIVAAPWRRVRSERPLDPQVEARLLLGDDPAAVASEEQGSDVEPGPDRDHARPDPG
ncbi:MAG: hypothetical protein M5U14_04785 [Acidimicrobiia bacterium]|nr:hypothetical protein [Acidimicrobiia bacterium]